MCSASEHNTRAFNPRRAGVTACQGTRVLVALSVSPPVVPPCGPPCWQPDQGPASSTVAFLLRVSPGHGPMTLQVALSWIARAVALSRGGVRDVWPGPPRIDMPCSPAVNPCALTQSSALRSIGSGRAPGARRAVSRVRPRCSRSCSGRALRARRARHVRAWKCVLGPPKARWLTCPCGFPPPCKGTGPTIRPSAAGSRVSTFDRFCLGVRPHMS
jgi:hypothetical protein